MRKILKFENVYISKTASVVGKSESEGPLKEYFDMLENDLYFGEQSWEMAEAEMAHRCLSILMAKSAVKPDDIDLLSGGDLLNQCISTSFAVRDTGIPFLGLYGACSTAAESLIVGAAFLENGFANRVITFASSHFCSAEKQYRFPLEYGGQRTPTAQNTVTGTGAFMLEHEGEIKVEDALIGRIIDNGTADANNMGAAMATAAVDTILRYFDESEKQPSDFDIIATGDLGREGYELACELFKRKSLNISDKFTDCGMLIYDIDKQDMHAGGSGCGCSAVVTAGLFYDKLLKGEAKNILLVGTGALLSQTSALLNKSIPSVAHLVHLSGGNK